VTTSAGPRSHHLSSPDRAGQVAAQRARTFVGRFFLFTAGVHLGIVMADPQLYAPFADRSPFVLVREGWSDVFMAAPAAWGLAVMVGELVIGGLLLSGGRLARAGWVAVCAFTALLVLFGFGFLWWSVPVLALLVPLAVLDWPRLAGPRRVTSWS